MARAIICDRCGKRQSIHDDHATINMFESKLDDPEMYGLVSYDVCGKCLVLVLDVLEPEDESL